MKAHPLGCLACNFLTRLECSFQVHQNQARNLSSISILVGRESKMRSSFNFVVHRKTSSSCKRYIYREYSSILHDWFAAHSCISWEPFHTLIHKTASLSYACCTPHTHNTYFSFHNVLKLPKNISLFSQSKIMFDSFSISHFGWILTIFSTLTNFCPLYSRQVW